MGADETVKICSKYSNQPSLFKKHKNEIYSQFLVKRIKRKCWKTFIKIFRFSRFNDTFTSILALFFSLRVYLNLNTTDGKGSINCNTAMKCLCCLGGEQSEHSVILFKQSLHRVNSLVTARLNEATDSFSQKIWDLLWKTPAKKHPRQKKTPPPPLLSS